MILKGIMEINATYIKANVVENDFRTEEIKWCERDVATKYLSDCLKWGIFKCYLYIYFLHF